MKFILITIFLTFISLSTATRRIVGGIEVEIKDAPYQAGIIIKKQDFYSCGGSFLSETFVITAAHCTERWQPYELEVSGGSIYYTKENSTRFQVEEKFDHPKYTQEEGDYDYSLLRLEEIDDFPEIIKFIRLPAKNEPLVVGERLFVAGWGRTESGSMEDQEILLGTIVPVMSDQKCRINYANGGYPLTDRMFCAGFDRGGTDSCSGDSGSGIATTDREDIILVGIVSWGIGCAEENHPGVYAKVSYVVDWINYIMY